MPDEAVATAEVAEEPLGLPQEPPAPEAQPEPEASGETEEADPRAAALEALGEIVQDEEIAEAIIEKLPQSIRERLQGPEAEREKWEAEKESQDYESTLGKIDSEATRARDVLRSQIGAFSQEQVAAIRKEAEKAGIEDFDLDDRNLTAALDQARERAEQYTYGFATRHMGLTFKKALASTPAAKYLTAEERQSIREFDVSELATNPDTALPKLLQPYIDAALRGAPEAAKAKAAADLDKQTKYAEAMAKIAPLIGNGKGKTPEARTTQQRTDKELLADPTTPISTLIEIRARQQKG